MDPSLEKRRQRRAEMIAIRETEQLSYRQLGARYGMSAVRARDIVTGEDPQPIGVRRGDPKRVKELRRRIAAWEQRLADGDGNPDVARARVAKYAGELQQLTDGEAAEPARG